MWRRRGGPAPRTREELLTRLDDVLADEWPAAKARLTARLAACLAARLAAG
ncbi:hypothetical protein ABZ093_17385 [Streptomyces cyaneofuscatus]|uniref:hypothetical protein n=1 Tax=Streptomyces cyaneofuscatus TaxID=66883 RepID=UPI0033AE0586